MKTQFNIRKSKKWAILFIVLMALSASMYAQPAVKSGYDKEVVSMVEEAWNNLDQLAVNVESHIRYQAPSVTDDKPEQILDEESSFTRDSNGPVFLVESAQERKDELKSNPRYGNDVMQVGYYQKSKNTAWYKIRNIVTKKPAVNCNVCTRVVSTPYVVYMKPRMK
jgi:hypothetical protein